MSPEKKAEILSRLDGLVLMKAFGPYFKDQWTIPRINKAILKKIAAPLECHKKGWVYMFRRKNLSEMVKIGFTKSDPDARMRQQMQACKFEIEFREHYEVDNPQRVESLIHAELRLFRRKEVSCNGVDACISKEKARKGEGGKEHGEWFEVTTEKAAKVMLRWVKWMNCQPYSQWQSPNKKNIKKLEYPLKRFADDYVDGLLNSQDVSKRRDPKPSGCDDYDYWQSWVDDFAETEKFKDDAARSEPATVRVQESPKVRKVLRRITKVTEEEIIEEYDEHNQEDDLRMIPRRSRRLAAY
jgi:hypothetical protein